MSTSRVCAAGWPPMMSTPAHKEGISSDDRRELVELRSRTRVPEMEIGILKRASAYLARDNVAENRVPAGRGARR